MINPPCKLILQFYHPGLPTDHVPPSNRSVSLSEILESAVPPVTAATTAEGYDSPVPYLSPFVANWRPHLIIALTMMLEELITLNDLESDATLVSSLWETLGGPPEVGTHHMNFRPTGDRRNILTGTDLQTLIHNSRESDRSITVHIGLHGRALRLFTSIIRPLRANRSSQDSASLLGMSVGHDTAHASTSRPGRSGTPGPPEIETVRSHDEGTATRDFPMTSAPRRQVSSISHAQSGHSTQPSGDYTNPPDGLYPEYDRWLAAKRESELQEQADQQARTSQRSTGRLHTHHEHPDGIHRVNHSIHHHTGAPFHGYEDTSCYSDQTFMNANMRNVTGVGPSLSPMFARTMGVHGSSNTDFTPLGILRLDSNGTPYEQPIRSSVNVAATAAAQVSEQPAWDSFSRTIHNVSNIPTALPPNSQRQPPMNYPIGTTWTKFQFDSTQGAACVDSSTGLILPWYTHRPDHGSGYTLHHAVEFNNLHMDRDHFISMFYETRYQPATQYKQFSYGFPTLSSTGDLRVILLPYLTSLVSYCSGFGIFLPPPQTVQSDLPVGTWFEKLPLHVKHAAESVFSGILATEFKKKSTGLVTHSSLAPLLQHTNGYTTFRQLLAIAGHPRLQDYPQELPEPRQSSDCTLSHYLQRWVHYIHRLLLDGTYLSDRYFYQQFIRNLHDALRPLLQPVLQQEIATKSTRNEALPQSFSLDSLPVKLTTICDYLGRSDLLTKLPRDLTRHCTIQQLDYDVLQLQDERGRDQHAGHGCGGGCGERGQLRTNTAGRGAD
jgi:hypothetical protein